MLTATDNGSDIALLLGLAMALLYWVAEARKRHEDDRRKEQTAARLEDALLTADQRKEQAQ